MFRHHFARRRFAGRNLAMAATLVLPLLATTPSQAQDATWGGGGTAGAVFTTTADAPYQSIPFDPGMSLVVNALSGSGTLIGSAGGTLELGAPSYSGSLVPNSESGLYVTGTTVLSGSLSTGSGQGLLTFSSSNSVLRPGNLVIDGHDFPIASPISLNGHDFVLDGTEFSDSPSLHIIGPAASAVPLPAAVWEGLVGMGMIGVMGIYQQRKASVAQRQAY